MKRSICVSMLALVGLLLPVLMRCTPSSAAPAATQPLAVLIVSDGITRAQLMKEEQIIALIHHSLDDQGLPREVLPILTYHLNKASEKAYCEKTLGIHAKDLVFLGLAQHRNQVVKLVMLREVNVKDPSQAVARLFQKAVAVLSGPTPTPTPTQTATSTPDETRDPTPERTPGPRVMSAALCRSVNSGGEAVDRATQFGPRDTFYVSSFIKGLRNGTEIEARWYNGGTLIRAGRIVSNKIGDYFAWFALSPKPEWSPGSYRVTILIDGEQQATEYFRVNASE